MFTELTRSIKRVMQRSLIVGSFKFGAVVGVNAVDLTRTLGNDRAYEEASGAALGFIWEKYPHATLWSNHR